MSEHPILTFSDDSTNYLTEDKFNQLMWGMEHLDAFTSESGRPPMTSFDYKVLLRILYGCGLRVGEGLKLTKKDFDLQHKILMIWNPKSKKGGFQKTTILPRDIPLLETYLKRFTDENQIIFPVNRQNVWRYCKDAGRLAGLDIFEEHESHDVEGIWTHLFRKSCAKNMRNKGAAIEIVAIKLRHNLGNNDTRTTGVTYTYTMPDFNTLLQWEKENFPITNGGKGNQANE